MTTFEIPLLSTPQTFSVTLAGTSYNMRVLWNQSLQAWVLDIADLNDNPMVGGIVLTPGVDLLGQYPHLNFGGSLYVQTDYTALASPTFDSLGKTSHLYFVVTP